MILDPRLPSGPITDKWDRRKFENKLVNPANRRKYSIIVVASRYPLSSRSAIDSRRNSAPAAKSTSASHRCRQGKIRTKSPATNRRPGGRRSMGRCPIRSTSFAA